MATEMLMEQRHGAFWYRVVSADSFEAVYQLLEVDHSTMSWNMKRQRIFRGETAHMDAERAMTDDLINAIHRGVDPL